MAGRAFPRAASRAGALPGRWHRRGSRGPRCAPAWSDRAAPLRTGPTAQRRSQAAREASTSLLETGRSPNPGIRAWRYVSLKASRTRRALPLLVDPVLEVPQSFDLDLDPVAGLEEFVAAGPDAGGGAREDQVAGVQRGNARQVRDLLGGGKDHPAGVRVLLQGAVDPQPDGEALRIGDLGRRRDPRAERAAAFEALVRGPVEMERVPRRQRAAPRKVARGKIVGDGVAGDVIERLLD